MLSLYQLKIVDLYRVLIGNFKKNHCLNVLIKKNVFETFTPA